jgi:osmotically-inducible protein OsmY
MAHVLELPTPTVLPPSFPLGSAESPDLVLFVERALEKDEETRGAALDILARGGMILLFGNVGTESIKAAVERVARSVPGVTEVDNQLQVEPDTDT